MDAATKFDSLFRPLLTATVGAGAVALGILDFAASDWDGFGTEGRALIAVAARTAFLAFVVNAVLLVLAYLLERVIGPVASFFINLYGVGVFLAGTFLTGGLLSEALDLASPEAAAPPESVQVFLGVAGLGLMVLVAAISLGALADLAKRAFRPRPVAPQEEHSTDVQA